MMNILPYKLLTSAPPDAGLAPTDKFAGRATPLKGKGCPPADMKESEFRSAKHFISGTSFKDK